jgi:DNA-binding PadR family transcriptional regulator
MADPAHPYSIYREFNDSLGRVWRIGQAKLYAILKNAERSKLVSVETEASEGAPDRKVHHITEAGRKTFLEWLHAGSERVRNIRLEFLARLFFFRYLGFDGLEKAIALQKSVLDARITALEADIAEARRIQDDYWRLVLEFKRSEAKAASEWLDTCNTTDRRIV